MSINRPHGADAGDQTFEPPVPPEPSAPLERVPVATDPASALHPRRLGGESGQTTAEYALVLLAAAAIALLLLAWAAGTDGINRLFDAVIDSIIARVD